MTTRVSDSSLPLGVHVLPMVLQDSDCHALMRLPVVSHHDDSDGHNVHAKTLFLPVVAKSIWDEVKKLDLRQHTAKGVDAMMKLYRLTEGGGTVAPHVDDDFEGSNGAKALYSIIIYLDSDYDGGETIFNGSIMAPPHKTGSGLLFRHDILHEGRVVTRGVKHVLKTDLFVR